jgi:hypothetical protein
MRFRSPRYNSSSQLRIFVQRNAGAEAKKEFPKHPVWVKSKKRLIKGDKNKQCEESNRCELMNLHTIDKEKPTKKFVRRERKATEKKGKEHHPLSFWWFWHTHVTGEDDRRRLWEEPLLLALLQIRVIKR